MIYIYVYFINEDFFVFNEINKFTLKVIIVKVKNSQMEKEKMFWLWVTI